MAHSSKHPEDRYQIYPPVKLMLLYKVADQNATTGLFRKLEIAGLVYNDCQNVASQQHEQAYWGQKYVAYLHLCVSSWSSESFWHITTMV
eukprot:11726002-Ditylum_brightwellii.AAC.1